MSTANSTTKIQDSHIRAFTDWLKSQAGIDAKKRREEVSKSEEATIESISQVELQKLKEPFTIKP